MKVGILGTGGVATNSYLPVLKVIEDVELFYVNRTREKAEAAAESFGGAVCDSIEALAAEGLDTVFVLTRETQRLEAAMSLLQHKPKRIMFEKPLVARNTQSNVCEEDFFDARDLLATAKKAGAETAMIFNYRFFEHTQLAQRILNARDFGRVLTVNGHVHYACWSHCIDLIHCFAGPVAEVIALNGTREHKEGEVAATDIAAAFRTVGEATGVILGSHSMEFSFPLYDLVFGYEHGRISLRGLDDAMEVQDYRSGQLERITVPHGRSRWDQYGDTFKKSIMAYLATVRDGTPPPILGIDGLQELQFEAGLRRSAAEGRPVNLSEDLPLEV